jgi:phosphoserine / homoserine phosphotransferase
MNIICTDMEGVLVPEIWIGVAEATGIKELRLTTRDISDYDELMRKRLSILKENKITLPDIQRVVDKMAPLEGAAEFLEWLRSRVQTIVVSDTFSQFAGPLLKKLSWPTLFCNELVIGPNGAVDGYRLRQKDGKRKTVLALRSLEFRIVAMGDSYNDISMLKEADQGILFRPPENVRREFPGFPVTERFDELKTMIQSAL